MTKEARLKMILAYEFAGHCSFEAWDIETRRRIRVLIAKVTELFDKCAIPGGRHSHTCCKKRPKMRPDAITR
jgi:hypothetical protein